MTRLIVSPSAQADLADIWDFVAAESASSADRLLDELYGSFELLADLPDAGHHHESTPDLDLLCWPVRRTWLVFYRRADDVIEIARVVSGRRDLRQLP